MSGKVTRMLLSLGLIGASGAVGWGLLKLVSPSPEVLLKQLPENNPSVMRESKQKTQEWMDALKAAADDPNPIYKSFGAKKD